MSVCVCTYVCLCEVGWKRCEEGLELGSCGVCGAAVGCGVACVLDPKIVDVRRGIWVGVACMEPCAVGMTIGTVVLSTSELLGGYLEMEMDY